MNKLVIPSILTATVLIAGLFALMPVEKATTVHTTITTSRAVTEFVSLDGVTWSGVNFVAGTKVVALDTTNVGNIQAGHIAAVLPNTNNDTTCGAGTDAPHANIEVHVGVAGGTTANVVTAATNTGLRGGPDRDFAGDGTAEAQCVYHVDITPGAGGQPATITDVIVGVFTAGTFPNESYIEVTARL